ncbi:pancreatic triacylglycerol lipase-like [Scaptodrosophila lebanonensis]|uniref:Pancreatic triacylglycerol lipase-like n=1 Tax=Drosophila lebanonensis TaxID=7225 RepID=A0A6J2U820_DROLE|nr:pancreatic triacylglycerol lipase-like [Scaptodrosophila lebanonensis]
MRAALFLFIAHAYCEYTDPAARSCFVLEGDCPNENITFWLYSKETGDSPVLLNPLDLNPSDFEPPRPIDILIHGYTGHRDAPPNAYVRPALLDHEDVYVISIDFGPLVQSPCYPQAVQNVPLVAKCLARLIDNLLDRGIAQSDQLHIIGFSVGAHVAGQAANYVKRKLQRITGLDPAKPLFSLAGDTQRLDPSDADFVDVIHTDALLLGMLRPLGHVDFYPNNGGFQPGCHQSYFFNASRCNHDRAPRYYAESIYSKMGFWGGECAVDAIEFDLDRCSGDSPQVLMGYHVLLNVRGSYYLRTGSKYPYALGKAPHVFNEYLEYLENPDDIFYSNLIY